MEIDIEHFNFTVKLGIFFVSCFHDFDRHDRWVLTPNNNVEKDNIFKNGRNWCAKNIVYQQSACFTYIHPKLYKKSKYSH